jgi:hypothetical protein
MCTNGHRTTAWDLQIDAMARIQESVMERMDPFPGGKLRSTRMINNRKDHQIWSDHE